MADLQKIIKKSIIGNNFSDLPEELLETIFEYVWHNPKSSRLNAVVDLIRVSAVCKKWQRSSSRVKKQSCVACPLVLTLENSELCRLYDFSNNTSKEIRCHNSHSNYVCNSWNEWLVIVERSSPADLRLSRSRYQIIFYNIFSEARVQLQSSPVLYNTRTPIGLVIHKAIASCTPLDPNCAVMAIYSEEFNLAFCKVGDKRWTKLKGKSNFYDDIIYYKNKFYGIRRSGNLEVCCIERPKPKTLLVALAPSIFKSRVSKFHLAKTAGGDLLLIVKRACEKDIEEYFTVYKMNFSRRKWIPVNSFGGDNSIFIGRNTPIFMSTKDLGIRGDCIYSFTTTANEATACSYSVLVFNMKTKRFVSEYWQRWSRTMFWMTLM